jgi:dTDP-4-dehydrorhamnose reductase
MRVLVFGQSGQLARALALRADRDDHAVAAFRAVGRSELDLAALEPGAGLAALPTDLAESLAAFAPTHVINAAAYTAVDRAERAPEAAMRLNRDGAGVVARMALELSSALVHISTDYVYDGTKDGPYVETDRPDPRSVYGASKLAGEACVAAIHPGAVILRTAWLYSPFGQNFVTTMLRLAGERPRLSVVCDQLGCPTSALDLAAAILALLRQLPGHARAHEASGIYHAAGQGEASWHGFAEAIFAAAQRLGGPSVPVDPIPGAAYPTPARRPVNSRLSCEKLHAAFGLRQPPWERGLDDCMAYLLSDENGSPATRRCA